MSLIFKTKFGSGKVESFAIFTPHKIAVEKRGANSLVRFEVDARKSFVFALTKELASELKAALEAQP